MASKDREFTIEEMGASISATNLGELNSALSSAIRCPFTKCQSFDTALFELADDKGYERHHCNRCNRNFHVQRDQNGYSILGWYGE